MFFVGLKVWSGFIKVNEIDYIKSFYKLFRGGVNESFELLGFGWVFIYRVFYFSGKELVLFKFLNILFKFIFGF